MISIPVDRTKSFRLPPRAKPTVLDRERNFLSRFVRQAGKLNTIQDTGPSGRRVGAK